MLESGKLIGSARSHFYQPTTINYPLHAAKGRTAMNIDKLAHLARLELTPEEKQKFAGQLDSILVYFEQLKAVNVEGVTPSAHAFEVFAELRADEAGPTLDAASWLRNAPAARDNQIVVPRVVDDGN